MGALIIQNSLGPTHRRQALLLALNPPDLPAVGGKEIVVSTSLDTQLPQGPLDHDMP